MVHADHAHKAARTPSKCGIKFVITTQITTQITKANKSVGGEIGGGSLVLMVASRFLGFF